jgi:hypothetical protein
MINLKSLVSDQKKKPLIVYHGTDTNFHKFSLKKSTQGIIWFTSDKEKILRQEAGASGHGYVITAEVSIQYPAGWTEYEKYMLGQLSSMGHDGVILPTENKNFDCFVFSPSQIKIIKVEKIKPLLKEEEPVNADEWDSWYDYIEYFEYDIDATELNKLVAKYQLNYKTYDKIKVVKIWDAKKLVYLQYNVTDQSFELINDITQWVYDLRDNEILSLGIDPDNIYNGHIESSLKDLKENPGKVYHYTTEDKWEQIQSEGQMIGSRGSGINNRGAYGIFTSTNPEEHALGSYGNVCLELNLDQFKIENGFRELNLSFEPEDYLIRDYIMSVLELENRDDVPSDISANTVIVNHNIPTKYVRQI